MLFAHLIDDEVDDRKLILAKSARIRVRQRLKHPHSNCRQVSLVPSADFAGFFEFSYCCKDRLWYWSMATFHVFFASDRLPGVPIRQRVGVPTDFIEASRAQVVGIVTRRHDMMDQCLEFLCGHYTLRFRTV